MKCESETWFLICIILLCCTFFFKVDAEAQIRFSTISPVKQQPVKTDSLSLKKTMFIKVITSKNKIYVGEPVMVVYKFYTQIDGQAVVLKQPTFSGCSVKELNFDETPELEIVNGKRYRSYTIRKVQLTPVQPGKLSLGIAGITNHIELPDAENPFTFNAYDVNIHNDSSFVAAQALPQAGKPAGFNGLTGVFSLQAVATDSTIAAGENDHLVITIKGSGNLDAIDEPQVIWPTNTEHFGSSDSQHLDPNSFPASGDVVFDIPFIGKKEGTVYLQPVQFSFFNTASGQYQTLTSNSIAVTFTKKLPPGKFLNSDVVTEDVSNKRYLWIVPAIAAVAALIGFISYRNNKKKEVKKDVAVATTTPVPAFEPVVQYKYKTDFNRHWNDLQALTEPKLFFTKAKELLMRAVIEFTDTQHQSELFLLAEMKQKLTDAALCTKVFVLHELFNQKMYTPFETDDDLHFYFNEVKDVIEQLQTSS